MTSDRAGKRATMKPIVILFVASAACGDGAFVEVDTSKVPGVESVEIVVASGKCHHPFDDTECDHIQGEGFDRAFPGERDGRRNIFNLGITAEAPIDSDGRVSFQLAPGFGRVPMAFAIGRDLQGQAIGVAVMENTLDSDAGTIVFQVALDPTGDLLVDRPAGHAGFREWGVMGSHCIGVAPATDPDRDPAFIVPGDNPDCDARTSVETDCDPLWFDGFRFDEEMSQRHCAIRSRKVPPGPNAVESPCVLGHLPACTEVPPINPAEEPCQEQEGFPPLCLPSALCGPLPCTPGDTSDRCLQDALLGRNTVIEPRVLCPVPSVLSGQDHVPCMDPIVKLLPPPNLFATTTKCTDVRLTGNTPPFHAPREDKVVVGTTTFRINSFDDQCRVELVFEGRSSSIDLVVNTTLVVTLDAGQETREMMFPLELKLGSAIACPDPEGQTLCDIVGLDMNGFLLDHDLGSCALPAP
jgi:hypothetical protein